jgi:hypothetical protein
MQLKARQLEVKKTILTFYDGREEEEKRGKTKCTFSSRCEKGKTDHVKGKKRNKTIALFPC